MKNKRLISGLLACIMVLSMLPTAALAQETVTYTGMDVRLPQVTIGEAVADSVPVVKTATDASASTYLSDTEPTQTVTWYYAYPITEALPDDEVNDYTIYEYGAISAYVKPVEAGATFQDRMYLCVTKISTNNHIAENCEVYPGEHIATRDGEHMLTVNIEVHPAAQSSTIGDMMAQVDSDGHVSIDAYNREYTYVYRTHDGSKDALIENMPIGQKVGTYSINNCEYKELSTQIDVKNMPQIVILAVNTEEWKYDKTATIYEATVYTLPLTSPYVTVNTLDFNELIYATEVGSSKTGVYANGLAQVVIDGWFADREGKIPLEVESDGYLVCTVISYSLFEAGVQPHDFTLKCGTEVFVGESFIPYASSNAYKVAFFVPSNRISFSLESMTPGGSIFFYAYPDTPALSLKPNEIGTYGSYDIGIEVEPGYYVKNIYLNGEPWNSPYNPFADGTYHHILSTTGHMANITEYTPTADTHFAVEFAKADTITIEYGDNVPAFTDDEYVWHVDGQYAVSESYGTILCKQYALTDMNYTQHVFMLNTKEDGSGTAATVMNEAFVWTPQEEHQNGVSDSITLYVIMECDMHQVGGASDNSWQYFEAAEATCTTEGNVAYRHCPECDMYQTKNENGVYVFTPKSEIFSPKLQHEHTEYTNLDEHQHSVKCAHCDDSYIENHKLVNGVCVCGYYTYIKGDVNGDGYVTDADAVHLLYYTIFPEDYPINQPADFDGDGYVTDADAVYLLYYTIFPEDYPLQ